VGRGNRRRKGLNASIGKNRRISKVKILIFGGTSAGTSILREREGGFAGNRQIGKAGQVADLLVETRKKKEGGVR